MPEILPEYFSILQDSTESDDVKKVLALLTRDTCIKKCIIKCQAVK